MRGDGQEKNLKNAPKLEQPLLVSCPLFDCLFHEGVPTGLPDKTWCSHPHKRQHLLDKNCPFYQMDWAKKVTDFQKK